MLANSKKRNAWNGKALVGLSVLLETVITVPRGIGREMAYISREKASDVSITYPLTEPLFEEVQYEPPCTSPPFE